VCRTQVHEFAPGRPMTGLNLEGLTKFGFRLARILARTQGRAEVVVGRGRVFLEVDRLAEFALGFEQPALPAQGAAEIDTGAGALRAQGDCGPIEANRLVRTSGPEPHEREPQIGVHPDIIRMLSLELPQELDS